MYEENNNLNGGMEQGQFGQSQQMPQNGQSVQNYQQPMNSQTQDWQSQNTGTNQQNGYQQNTGAFQNQGYSQWNSQTAYNSDAQQSQQGYQNSWNSQQSAQNTWSAGQTQQSQNAWSTDQSSKTAAPAHEQRKPGVFGRLMMAVCMGLLFGLFAGGGFYAVQLVTGSSSQHTVQESAKPGTETAKEETQNSHTQNQATSLLGDQETYFRVLTTEETDITEVVEKTMPSMVSITEKYTVSTSFWGQTYTQEAGASGSGIIIGETDDEYIIVTNNHVIEDADEMTVTFISDEEVEAHLKGTDATVDIAVISVLKDDLSKETLEQICVAELGDSDSLVLGQNVIAIGNALGYGQSVTTGIVSALNREVTTQDGYTYECIQTDAAINPGNSGGALLNTAGQVIGINQSKSGGSTVEGMGYAIPITSVRNVIEELMGRDTLVMVDEDDMGYIGIYMQEVTSEIASYYNMPQGVYVAELVPGGGAEKAGIQVGDIIVGIDGNKAITNDGMKRLLRYYAVGDDVDITFMRNVDGEYVEQTVTVTLGNKPVREK